jgi:hypothetical protein
MISLLERLKLNSDSKITDRISRKANELYNMLMDAPNEFTRYVKRKESSFGIKKWIEKKVKEFEWQDIDCLLYLNKRTKPPYDEYKDITFNWEFNGLGPGKTVSWVWNFFAGPKIIGYEIVHYDDSDKDYYCYIIVG